MAQIQYEEKKRDVDDKSKALSVLKLDGKGWNPELFEKQAALNEYGHLCAACGAVCDNPAELACDVDHDDNEILAYCLSCLQQLITDNDQKCPINSHEEPVTVRNRLIRIQIANLIVFCPYSTHSQARQQQINEDDIAAAANRGVQDTLGAPYEEKEGTAGAQQPRQQRLASAAASRTEHVQTQCAWKGKLSELINNHIAECIKQNDPSFVYKSQIKALQKRVSELADALNEKQKEVESQATRISELLELNMQLQNELTMKKKMQREEAEEEEEEKQEASSKRASQRKLDAAKFTFNAMKKSKHIEIENQKTIRNTRFDSYNDHSIVFGPVIQCAQYKLYRIRFRINKMMRGFRIGFASSMSDLKNVEEGGPGDGDNQQTTTGIVVRSNDTFSLCDKDHDDDDIHILSSSLWRGWYSKRIGGEFLMEFDFVRNAFSLYWVSSSSSNRSLCKLFQIYNVPKHTIVPIFALYNKDDEIEIVECVLN